MFTDIPNVILLVIIGVVIYVFNYYRWSKLKKKREEEGVADPYRHFPSRRQLTIHYEELGYITKRVIDVIGEGTKSIKAYCHWSSDFKTFEKDKILKTFKVFPATNDSLVNVFFDEQHSDESPKMSQDLIEPTRNETSYCLTILEQSIRDTLVGRVRNLATSRVFIKIDNQLKDPCELESTQIVFDEIGNPSSLIWKDRIDFPEQANTVQITYYYNKQGIISSIVKG